MIITTSPDITLLQIQVIWDISGNNPQIILNNQSEGPNLAGIDWSFNAKSPTQTWIAEGNINDPDITGEWDSHTITSPWPRPFNQLEWSGAPYSFYCTIKDSDGNEYTSPVQVAFICRPNGNVPSSKNTFGLGAVQVQVKCPQAGVFFQDVTNTTYRGVTGTQGSSVLRLNYPMDETGQVPEPFQITNFVTAIAPISFSSPNYQFLYTSVWQYDLGDNCSVRIKYLLSKSFPVLCNIDLMPLVCEYTKLIQQVESGNCSNQQEASQKLALINSKMMLVFVGIEQPLTGVDVPALIEEIKLIGGWDCNCCTAATGIIPTNGSLIDGFNFQVITACGDISGYVQQVGNNIQFILADKSYTFQVCPDIPTEAITIVPTIDGCQKSYCLNIDMSVFAADLLNVIANDVDLVNLFNSIVINGGGDFDIVVDGKCVWQSSTVCDYVFTLSNIPSSGTFAILTGFNLTLPGPAVNFAFNLTNLPALQAYLNGLGYGTFVVSAGSPTGTVLIETTNNPNNIVEITYSVASTNYIAEQSKICEGYVPITVQEAIQNLVNYICDLDDSQLVTSAEYVICYIDPDDGTSKTATVSAGESLTTFISTLLARGCDTIEYIQSLATPTCDAIKTIFNNPFSIVNPNTTLLANNNGTCVQLSLMQTFLKMLQDGFYNNDIVTAFCQIVNLCRGDYVCTPYSQFSAELIPYDESCPAIVGFYITLDEDPSPVYVMNVIFANNVSTNQDITIEQRPAGSISEWSVLEASQEITVSGTNTGSAEVASIGGLSTGSYDFRISSNCLSPFEYIYLYNVEIQNIP